MNQANTKILLVDDEQDILEFLQHSLQKEGYQVFTASNGRKGLEMAEKEKPDVIVLDIMMPELDGVEVCRRLREKPEFQKTLIVFLTARDEDFTQVAALDVGGDDYITKPVRPRVFVSRLNAMLRRAEKSGNIDTKNMLQLVYGDLLIDKEKVSVTRNNIEIGLAKKEFELLSLLITRPGKVYTRAEIFNKIWGNDVIVGDRTIDVHIRKLREKIGEECIGTVKGIGYKFEL